MKFRKLVSLLLAAAMVTSLTACGGSKSSTSGTNAAAAGGAAGSEATAETEIPVAEGVAVESAPWYRGDMKVFTAGGSGFAKKDKDTLVVGSGNQIIGCDPLNSQNEYPWTHNVYESLITTDWETGEFEPLLATEWGYDEEGNFKIALRENVKFHDGTMLDAEDVLFTLKRNADDTSSQVNDACSKVNYEKSTIEDDLHLTLVFDEPSSSFVDALASGYLGILSKDFFEANPSSDFFEEDAGTGAYKVIETVSGVSQRFERFDEYWGEAPYFKYVKAVLYKDWSVASIDFINGDVDILQSNKDYQTLMQFMDGTLENVILYQLPVNRGYTLYMSTSQGPLADENIRRAIAHAIDYSQFITGVYQTEELGGLATSIVLPGTQYYADDLSMYEYDPGLSAEYLAKAGYDTVNRLSLKVETSDNADLQATCEIMQYFLSEIGIDLECVFEKSAAMTAALNSNEYAFDMIAYPMQYRSGHPQEALVGRDAWGKSYGEYAYIKGIQSEELSNLMKEGSGCLDDERAEEIYREIQHLFHDNVWSIPLSVTKSACYVHDYLEGCTFTDGFCNLWQNVKLAE